MGEKEMLVHKSHNTDATNAACFSGGVEVLTENDFLFYPPPSSILLPPCATNFLHYSRTSTNNYLFTMATFCCPQGGCCREVQL